MKQLLLSLLTLTCLTACEGTIQDTINGEFSVTSRTDHLILKDSSDVWHNIIPGSYQMSVSSGMGGGVQLFKDGQILMKLSVPASALSGRDVTLGTDETGQIYSIRKSTKRSVLSTTYQSLKEACTGPGTCYGCSIYVNSRGQTSQKCGVAPRFLCPGTKDQYYQFDTVNYGINLDFLFNGNVHGSFVGQGQQKIEKTLVSSGSCIPNPVN